MSKQKLDSVRESVLEQMDKQNRYRQYAIMAAALFEGLFLAWALILINWSDKLQVLIFLLFMLMYTVIGMGLIALGVHVTHNASRVIAAIEAVGATR